MNEKSGGQSLVDRQRQAAAEIARRNVLASYSTAQKGNAANINANVNNNVATYKNAPVQAKQNTTDWKKYHSAWQNYYQKYYSDYYAKAAREYIQTERVKYDRAQREREQQRQLEELRRQPEVRRAIVSAPGATGVGAATKGRGVAPGLQGSGASGLGMSGAIISAPEPVVGSGDAEAEEKKRNIAQALKEKIQKKASDEAQKARKSRHFMPLIVGVTVVLLALFLQYNRLIFAPIMAYVSPGNVEDDGITAIDATVTANPGPEPKLIIPKLNVDVPVHFGISNDEATVMEAMNSGVAQFAVPGADAMPGQVGNLVISGHSAGDIYSNNQYKFIFSGLERLVVGDTIYVNYESKRYTYAVTKLDTVEPTDVQALVYETNKPVLTLITCTPLGTSRYRLLVTAEQVDPTPESATRVEPVDKATTEDAAMPANEPSFFEGVWRWLTGQS